MGDEIPFDQRRWLALHHVAFAEYGEVDMMRALMEFGPSKRHAHRRARIKEPIAQGKSSAM